MVRSRSFLKNALLLALALPLGAAAQFVPVPAQDLPWAGTDGAWTFFTDPRAVYHKGAKEKVYLGFLTRAGRPRVWSYDYANGQIDTATLRNTGLEMDDHDNPSMYVHLDGRITAIYQRHSVDRTVYLRTTTNPEDITAWGPERTVTMPANVTYAHAFRLSGENNKLYLFSRTINWHPTVMTSTDEGTTWDTPRQFIGGGAARPYVKYRSDGVSRIHFAFTDGHPRDVPQNHLYHAYYENGNFYRTDGSLIRAYNGVQLEPSEATRVYNASTAGRGWIWDISLDSAGRPVMVYMVAPQQTDHRYYYSRWDGTQWRTNQITPAGKWFPATPNGTTEREPHYSGGIILNPQDPAEVFLSKPRAGDSIFEIERWRTSDMGVSWTSQMITSGSQYNNARPVVPWPTPGQKNPKLMVFWMSGPYVHYTNYNTGIKYAIIDSGSTSSILGNVRSPDPAALPVMRRGTLLMTPQGPKDALGRTPALSKDAPAGK